MIEKKYQQIEGSMERYAGAAQAIESALEIVNTPSVEQNLGEYAVNLAELLHRSKVATTDREGLLMLGESFRDTIPVAPRQLGEVALLHIKDASMTKYQKLAIDHQEGLGEGERKAKMLQNVLNQSVIKRKRLPAFEQKNDLGHTVNLSAEVGLEEINGRPIVLMNMHDTINNVLSPMVLLHEMTHVLQKERRPSTSLRDDLDDSTHISNELEAHYVVSQTVRSMDTKSLRENVIFSTPIRYIDMAQQIDAIRRINQPANNTLFTPNSIMEKELASKKVLQYLKSL